MGYLKYVKQLYQRNKKEVRELLQDRLVEWRKGRSVVRIEKPTRMDRARAIGYKAKKGYLMVRVKALRSKRQRPLIKKGRRSKNRRRKKIIGKSYQWICEERANRKFVNCEVLGSYLLFRDGQYMFYEVLLGDKEILKTYNGMSWIAKNTGRAYRGLTASGKRSRGLLTNKGKGAEKLRPSLAAHGRRGKN